VNEISSTYQIYCVNVYVVTIYYNFSLKMISLTHFILDPNQIRYLEYLEILSITDKPFGFLGTAIDINQFLHHFSIHIQLLYTILKRINFSF